MRRRILSAALVVTAALLTACSDQQVPTAPIINGGPASLLGSLNSTGVCVAGSGLVLFPTTDEGIKSLITNLFIDANHQSSTLTMWEGIKRDKLDSRPLQNHIDNLAKWTLEHLAADDLRDPDGVEGLLNETTGAVRLLDLVFRCTGETPTQVPEPPAGFNATFEMVDPLAGNQQFSTSGGNAAGFFPGNSLNARTMLVMVFQPEEVQVNTPFPKLSQTIDVALAGGRLKENQNLSVLFCPTHELTPAVDARAVIAHQFQAVDPNDPDTEIGDGVEYLDGEEAGALLICPDGHDHANAWREEKGFLKQRAMQVAWYAKRALRVISPKPAYAGHAGIGGRFDADSDGDFSPMVAVDPYLETQIVLSPIQQPIVYGRAVQVQARLQVTNSASNPEVYRNTFVNPDAVTEIVNQTKILPNTNVLMSARIDAGAPTVAITTDDSFGNWAFTCVSAGNHTATVNFPETQVVANAPLYGASTATTPEFTVQPRPITVEADDKEWVYGDNRPALTGSITPAGNQGVQTQCGDVITPALSTDKDNTSDAGPYEGAIIAETNPASNTLSNYVVTKINGDVTITPRPISLTVVQPASRQYGDPNGPALNAAYDTDEFRNDDVLTFDISSTAVPLSAAGTSWPITTTPTGARLPNYDVTVLPPNPTLSITQRILTGSINPASRPYGDANPEFSGTVGNTTLCCDATEPSPLTWTFVTTADATSPVVEGGYPITVQLGGGPQANYDASGITGTLTVTPRSLRVAAISTSRQYGDLNPEFTYASGAVNGDAFDVTFSTTASQGSNVGTYPVTITNVTNVGGSPLVNYNLVGTNPGQLTVTQRPLSGEIGDNSKTQGQPNPDPLATHTISNNVAGDGFVITLSTTAVTESPVGNYPITVNLGVAGGSNYSWNTANDGNLEVTAGGIPNPALVFEGTEEYTVEGNNFTRYNFTVSNRSSYSAEMFALTSAHGPCGGNTTPSRTWAEFYTGETYIYGFCGFDSPDNLDLIWFAVPSGTAPPSPVHLRLKDRQTGITYMSNPITLP